MCIRDSHAPAGHVVALRHGEDLNGDVFGTFHLENAGRLVACLLYTSDAADERSSVDLGGRRIIKKKRAQVHLWITC